MISFKIASIVAIAAFACGSIFAPPVQQAIAAVIATDVQCAGCVGTSDLANGAVTSSKIKDGTITFADLSQSAAKIRHLNDCNCAPTQWDPDGNNNILQVNDNAATPNSVILVSLVGFSGIICSAYTANPGTSGYFFVQCSGNVPNGMGINYVLFNK